MRRVGPWNWGAVAELQQNSHSLHGGSLDGHVLLVSVGNGVLADSLDPDLVRPSELQAYIRGHWQVENCLHFVKDRWSDEDRHYTKRPGLAEAFASLTNAALAVLRPPGQPLRATAERIQWRPGPTLSRLGFNPIQ